jgi:hypothetical protein
MFDKPQAAKATPRVPSGSVRQSILRPEDGDMWRTPWPTLEGKYGICLGAQLKVRSLGVFCERPRFIV